MSAISSNGASFNALKKGTWKSGDFIEFVTNIFDKLILWGYESRKIGVILDNWAIHRSSASIEFLNSKKMNIYFIPPYLPEVVPIEKYFSILKSTIWRRCKGKTINLWSEEAESLIQESINSISEDSIISLWSNLFNEMETILDNSKDLI